MFSSLLEFQHGAFASKTCARPKKTPALQASRCVNRAYNKRLKKKKAECSDLLLDIINIKNNNNSNQNKREPYLLLATFWIICYPRELMPFGK